MSPHVHSHTSIQDYNDYNDTICASDGNSIAYGQTIIICDFQPADTIHQRRFDV